MPPLYAGSGVVAADDYCDAALQFLHERAKEALVDVLDVLLLAPCVAVMPKLVRPLDVDIDRVDRLEALCRDLCLLFIRVDVAGLEHLHAKHLGNPDLDWHVDYAANRNAVLFADRVDVW